MLTQHDLALFEVFPAHYSSSQLARHLHICSEVMVTVHLVSLLLAFDLPLPAYEDYHGFIHILQLLRLDAYAARSPFIIGLFKGVYAGVALVYSLFVFLYVQARCSSRRDCPCLGTIFRGLLGILTSFRVSFLAILMASAVSDTAR